MALDVLATTTITSPPGAVAAFASDPANDPAWIGGIATAEWLTEPPLREGSRIERVAKFLGRRIEYEMEVVEYEPGHRVRMASIRAPFPMEVEYSFEDDPNGCRASIRVQGGSGAIFRLAGALMAWQVERSITKDLRTLKAHFES